MFAKVDFPVKGLATGFTGKRLETHVLSAVCDQVGRLAKAFTTLPTVMRFLSGVNKRVFLHI